MQERSGSQFVKRIQSGPDAFDKSRFILTFLTILGDTKILCNSKLVLEGKTGKEIPELSPFKNNEKCFLFCLKSLFHSEHV